MKKLTELLKTSMTWLTRVRKKAHSGHFWWFCTDGGEGRTQKIVAGCSEVHFYNFKSDPDPETVTQGVLSTG